MSAYTYLYTWEIVDDGLPQSVLQQEALTFLQRRLAYIPGAQITGPPKWKFTPDNRLVCRLPVDIPDTVAVPHIRWRTRITPGLIRSIQQLAARGATNSAIARELGLDRKTVIKYVREWRDAA